MLRRIGFLGGSFDPVHNGHLQLALAAARALALEEVRFIPSAQSWQKDVPGASGEQRAAMLRLALAQPAVQAAQAQFTVDERELARGGMSYSIDTARELRAGLGPDAALFMLLGADQFLNLATWREWRGLFDLVNIAAAGRPGYELDQQHWPPEIVGACASRVVDSLKMATTKAFGEMHLIKMAPVEVSATALRAALGQHAGRAGLAAMLPAPVFDYIERWQIYST